MLRVLITLLTDRMSSDAILPTSADASLQAAEIGQSPLPESDFDLKDAVESAKATLADAQAYLDQVQRQGLT